MLKRELQEKLEQVIEESQELHEKHQELINKMVEMGNEITGACDDEELDDFEEDHTRLKREADRLAYEVLLYKQKHSQLEVPA